MWTCPCGSGDRLSEEIGQHAVDMTRAFQEVNNLPAG
jgi:hypothetical protein